MQMNTHMEVSDNTSIIEAAASPAPGPQRAELTADERKELLTLAARLRRLAPDASAAADSLQLRRLYDDAYRSGRLARDIFGLHPAIHALRTGCMMCESLSPDRSMLAAILLTPLLKCGCTDAAASEAAWGADVATLLRGMEKVDRLYSRGACVESENFRNLMLTFAEDIRVIIIMIVERTVLMQAINHHPDKGRVRSVAREAKLLYAPLAHRLGLYKIKGTLEDLALKYTNREIYTRIARKLNATKASRDAYIAAFIEPVRRELEAHGLKFDIKGRTKSISSIWNKIQKQNNDLEHIYDLFAIRVILDVPPERERSECWLVYSLITDMYQPNPARLKDWLSIPKSNGYESLHITVRGPEGRWVEVQIRSRRMDEIAEKGVAAHWKYKGIKAENNLDTWMNHVREIIEGADQDSASIIKDLKMNVYDEEVFVFTPKGDLFRLPLGATVLDFAFHIHSRIGCTCTGARINGRTRRINHKLQSGDTVEIITSANQTPKADWLSFVVTSKARSKIRQSINERNSSKADLGRELLQRRMKNRKVEMEEAQLMRVIKKLGYRTATDFFTAIAQEELDPADVLATHDEMQRRAEETAATRSAEEFTLQQPDAEATDTDVLVIGDNIKGVSYRMSRCCNPIYGDDVFGFVSSEGSIKIHRTDCPNAMNLRQRYPYRVIPVRWAGRSGNQFAATLLVVGHDDIGIVTNISSIINKERDVALRSIAIDSHDGMFSGRLTVGVTDTSALDTLIKKLRTVKGVKDVKRNL